MNGLRLTNWLVLALGLLAASSAQADTVDLLCRPAAGGPSVNISVDMVASTAAAWTSGLARKDGVSGSAMITADQITWGPLVANAPAYTLDRNSGALTILSPSEMGTPYAVAYMCKRSTPVL
jgi:hypothetical protein